MKNFVARNMLIILGVIGLIASLVTPMLINAYNKSNYDKYYEQAKNDIECEKIETQAICSKSAEEININTNKSVMNYSFYINEGDNYEKGDKTYYDTNIRYKKDDTYNCTFYRFRCTVSRGKYQEQTVLVVGNGTTSSENESFDFNKIKDDYLDYFTDEIIIGKVSDYSLIYAFAPLVSALIIILGCVVKTF